MKKTINYFADLRCVITPEIKKALIEYQKYTTFRFISETLDIHSSYLSLIRHNSAEKISLSSLLSIADKLGLRYQMHIGNTHQPNNVNVEYTFDHSYVPQCIAALTAQRTTA